MSTPDQNQNQYIVATPPTNENGTDPKTAATALKITAFLVFTPLVLLVIAWIVGTLLQDGDNSDMARVQCEQAVERQLKAPASARHSHTPSVVETGDEEWRVTSFTDAQNSFGAMIRKEWTCNVTYYEVLETWQTSIEFAD